ncbi:MAG TPA: hypothetical protein VEJ47_22115 [Candidatus Eremiobacteraceae bacterium]|nr:hypothetical protein [Candidatus Eremiobacteraceae bacterium]
MEEVQLANRRHEEAKETEDRGEKGEAAEEHGIFDLALRDGEIVFHMDAQKCTGNWGETSCQGFRGRVE